MSQNIEQVKESLIEAVSKTMENMAFEQVELIEKDQELSGEEVQQELPPEVIAMLAEESESGDDNSGDPEATDATAQNGNEMLWTTIPIMKPYRGELVLIFNSGYAHALTEAIYGDLDDPDFSSPTVFDAVGEIINTIAGRFLGNLIPADEEFELGLPNTGEGDPPKSEKEVVTLKFNLGGDILTAVICGEEFESLKNCKKKIKETIS